MKRIRSAKCSYVTGANILKKRICTATPNIKESDQIGTEMSSKSGALKEDNTNTQGNAGKVTTNASTSYDAGITLFGSSVTYGLA